MGWTVDHRKQFRRKGWAVDDLGKRIYSERKKMPELKHMTNWWMQAMYTARVASDSSCGPRLLAGVTVVFFMFCDRRPRERNQCIFNELF